MKNGDRVLLSNLKRGQCFRFSVDGPVWVKVRGGFRPGLGGDLHACNPSQAVFFCAFV